MADESFVADEQIDQPDELQRLKARNAQLEKSLLALEDKKENILTQKKRLGRLERLISSMGIDIADEDAENEFAEQLIGFQQQRSGQVSTDGSNAVDPQAAPPQTDAAAAQPPAAPPHDPIRDAELKRLQRQVQKLAEDAAAAEKAKEEAIAKNRQERIERIVTEAFQKAGAANPTHAYRLMSSDSRFSVDLSEDGKSVVGGPDYAPKPLIDVINAFKEDESFQYMFQGSGITGSGVGSRNGSGAAGSSSAGSANNPFRTDSLNLTEAALLFNSNPERAKRLMSEARSVGKLDTRLAEAFK